MIVPALPALLVLAAAIPQGRVAVDVELSDGREWFSVSARSTSLETVLWEIAHESGRRVEGLDASQVTALVTVDLVRRPLDQTLEYVLGSVGLRAEVRATAIVVIDDEDDPPTPSERLDEAALAWLKVTTRFPGHEAAPGARLAQGEVAELQGNLAAARTHYQTLVEDYPDSSEVATAMMRTGRILQRLGHWAQASVQYRALVGLEKGAEYHPAARLELARCAIELGDPQSALHMLSALDSHYPAATRTERTSRLLARAEALNARGRHMEALRSVENASTELDPTTHHDALRIRAIALEGVGLPGDAGSAWLLYAENAHGSQKAHAYERAARLALEADDEMGTLFACRQAANDGFADVVQRYKVEARRRLGFEEGAPAAAEPVSRSERIALAEEHLASDEIAQAGEILQPLFLARNALDEDDRARVCAGWAACVESRNGLDEALRLLAEERATLTDADARARLDVGAARLLEKNELFDRAIDAYRGSY